MNWLYKYDWIYIENEKLHNEFINDAQLAIINQKCAQNIVTFLGFYVNDFYVLPFASKYFQILTNISCCENNLGQMNTKSAF